MIQISAKQRIIQSFSPDLGISFPPLGDNEGDEGPMMIETEIGGHCVHCMYVDGGSASEILYEHCFKRLRRKIRYQMVPATAPLIGFSGEVIWPIGQVILLLKIGDKEHATSAWMKFLIIRSQSPHNEMIGTRWSWPQRLLAVPSTAHGVLKFPDKGGVLTLRSSKIIPLECTMVSEPAEETPVVNQRMEE